MPHLHRIGCALALLALVPLLLCASTANGQEREAKMYAISNWDGGCTGATRSSWDDMAMAWYDGVTAFWVLPGWSWTRSGRQVNGNIVDSEFTDCFDLAWGNDCNHADAGDAVMIALHGGNASSDHRWYGKVRVNESGEGNCNTYQGHMRFGDNDLEFLHLSSCFSMDREDWWSEWNSSFDGLHQVDGFHGIMWIYNWLPEYYSDFAFDAFFMSMADAFIDNLYVPNINDSGYDECPVARNVGVNSADSRLRMDTERYSAVFADPPGLGTARSHRARHIRGCDPKGKEALD